MSAKMQNHPNGVDVDRLVQTVSAIKEKPDLAKFSFRASTNPNAVESVLQALASCLTVGFAYNAAVQGITVKSLEFDLEGEIDLHGFLGLSDKVRPGFQAITLAYRTHCDASPAKLEELWAHVQKTSPVLDILRNPVRVKIERAR